MDAFSGSKREQNFAGNLIQINEQLYYYALQLTENRDDAQDLVQETNFKALKHYAGLKDHSHKNAWLYTILRNTYINSLRSGHKKNMRYIWDNNDQQTVIATLPEYDHPDRVYERKELISCIRCLPAHYSKPLKLHLAGYSYKEIAHMTNIPIGTIKSRIHLAKEKLKKMYASC